MAQVDTALQREIDELLERSRSQWARLPQVEAAIDGWEPDEQIVFLVEWPIQERSLCRLEELAANGTLTPEQMTRYSELQRLVELHRPIIRRLQAS